MHHGTTTRIAAPCPKCKRGSFYPGQSLSNHLDVCTGPLLWSSFQLGQINDKRTHDEMTSTNLLSNRQRASAISQEMSASQSGLTRTANHLSNIYNAITMLVDQRQHDTYQFETDNNNDINFDNGGEEVDVDNIGTNTDSVNTIELNGCNYMSRRCRMVYVVVFISNKRFTLLVDPLSGVDS